MTQTRTTAAIIAALAALALVACAKVEEPGPALDGPGQRVELTATMGSDTRASVTNLGVTSWSEGDAIAVYTSDGAITPFGMVSLSGGTATFSADLAPGVAPSVLSVFPSANFKAYSGSTATIAYPAAHNYADDSMEAPMYALIGGSTLSFRHLGGMIRVSCSTVPSAATDFHLVANGMRIVGIFTVTPGEGMKVESYSSDTNTKCRVHFTASEGSSKAFNVPVPAGTYPSIYAYFTDEAGNKITEWQVLTDVTIQPGEMYVRSMPAGLLRVASFNILSANPNSSNETSEDESLAYRKWASRKPNMIAGMARRYVNLYGLQEATSGQTNDILGSYNASAFTYQSGSAWNTSVSYNNSTTAATILYDNGLTLLASGKFWYSPTPSVPSTTKNESGKDYGLQNCNWARLRWNGVTFYVFNTHLAVNSDGIASPTAENKQDAARRVYQAGLLLEEVKKVSDDFPVIVTGDFNCTADAVDINGASDAMETLLDDGTLRDARVLTPQPHGSSGSLTYFKSQAATRRIDFVLVNDKVTVQSYRIDNGQQTSGFWESDHNPVLVDITFNE